MIFIVWPFWKIFDSGYPWNVGCAFAGQYSPQPAPVPASVHAENEAWTVHGRSDLSPRISAFSVKNGDFRLDGV
jgi:hypothetical protein